MKTILAVLLSFIITEAPVLAIHGGYTLGGTTSLVGTYGGVLIPSSDVLLSGSSTSFGANGLGLFTLNVPYSGPITGETVIFSNGRTFTGPITGFPDPENANGILAVINATYDFTISEPTFTNTNGTTVETFTSVAVTAIANGSFKATTSSDTSGISPTGLDLNGTAELSIDDGAVNQDGSPIITEEATFDVEGFQQSSVPTTAQSTLTAPTTTTTGG